MDGNSKKYYAAYDERYKTAHKKGFSWSSPQSTPIVMEVIRKYRLDRAQTILEVGCGEGRDARTVFENGYSLTATDLSEEAIRYCKETMPQYTSRFRVLDCLSQEMEETFDFIYSVAVIHMLVPDSDRRGFYQFIGNHLSQTGVALICSMGDGHIETQTDTREAFALREREHESGKMMVAATSCRMVSFPTFEAELQQNHLKILEKGITDASPNFNSLMYAVVQKE